MFERPAIAWKGKLVVLLLLAAGWLLLNWMVYNAAAAGGNLGSSLGENPQGTSILVNSYQRAGYRVVRGLDDRELADLDPGTSTALLIGGGAQPFPAATIDRFVQRGGRAVVLAPPLRRPEVQAWAQRWGLKFVPGHGAGTLLALPAAELSTLGVQSLPANGAGSTLLPSPQWVPLYSASGSPGPIFLARRTVAGGQLIVASQLGFVLNRTLIAGADIPLLDWLPGGRPLLWVSEAQHGLTQRSGVLWLLQRYHLVPALLLLLASLAVAAWSLGGELVEPSGASGEQAPSTPRGAPAGTAARRLLRRALPRSELLTACYQHYCRRDPRHAAVLNQDRAIANALHREALEGYNQIWRSIQSDKTRRKVQ